MLASERVFEVFEDAKQMHVASLERLEQDDIRDAPEKAWCATKRAVDALVLARTGHEPEKSPVTTRELVRLSRGDDRIRPLVDIYFRYQGALHGDCFYLGLCEPMDAVREWVREVADFIRDCQTHAENC